MSFASAAASGPALRYPQNQEGSSYQLPRNAVSGPTGSSALIMQPATRLRPGEGLLTHFAAWIDHERPFLGHRDILSSAFLAGSQAHPRKYPTRLSAFICAEFPAPLVVLFVIMAANRQHPVAIWTGRNALSTISPLRSGCGSFISGATWQLGKVHGHPALPHP